MIKKEITRICQENQRNKIILTLGNGTILVISSTDIIKRNISTNKRKDNQWVFECLINMVPQDTTTDGYQTHGTIQNLKFGVYLLIVYWKHNRIDDEIKHNLH